MPVRQPDMSPRMGCRPSGALSSPRGRSCPILEDVNDPVKDLFVPQRTNSSWRGSASNGRWQLVDMPEIIKLRRGELGLSQTDLAVKAGVDKRQIRRYEAGETQPTLSVAATIARALGLSLDELAGEAPTKRADLSGEWWACWQSWKDGEETLNPQHVLLRQRADMIEISSVTRGTTVEDGGYNWQGELRLWDNEALMGWYVANDGAVRSKGTMYFAIHRHGTRLFGRWVGLSYDGPVVTGWATMARNQDESSSLMDELRSTGQVPA